jgi:hypothetical protein
MELPISTDGLLTEAQKFDLYQALILQLNKDFAFANAAVDLPVTLEPTTLKMALEDKIFRLLSTDYGTFLNLLYILDVSEEKVKKLDGSDRTILAEDLVFLILKRIWQKVWFRHFYTSSTKFN